MASFCKATLTALAAGLTMACAAFAPAHAQAPATSTLDKIKASGKVVLGVRETSPPMAYALGANEKYVGYHVELCERVLKEIVPQAKLEYMAVTAQNTLPLVQNGTLDIGCGPTTNNTARQQQVAFAVTTYVSAVRMAVRADSDIKSISQLGNRTIAASTGTSFFRNSRDASFEPIRYTRSFGPACRVASAAMITFAGLPFSMVSTTRSLIPVSVSYFFVATTVPITRPVYTAVPLPFYRLLNRLSG